MTKPSRALLVALLFLPRLGVSAPAFYAGESSRLDALRALKRSGRYRELILSALSREGLPPELFYLPLVESEFNPRAVSKAGAAGLWQLMPQTARDCGLEVSEAVDERLDPEKSTRAALRHLKALRAVLGNWSLALAAYNCGEARLRSALARGEDLPLETRHFVPKFVAAVLLGRSLFGGPSEPQPRPAGLARSEGSPKFLTAPLHGRFFRRGTAGLARARALTPAAQEYDPAAMAETAPPGVY